MSAQPLATMERMCSLSLTSLEEIQRTRSALRDRLETALMALSQQYGDVPLSIRLSACKTSVIELFCAYAGEAFDCAAALRAQLQLSEQERQAGLTEIANSVLTTLIPVRLQLWRSFLFCDLGGDPEYRARLITTIQGRVQFWGRPLDQTPDPGSAKARIRQFIDEKSISITEFARRADVDVSVIYALQRGQRKCARDKLKEIAALLECKPEDLLPGA